MTALAVVLLVLTLIGLLPVGVWAQFDRGDLALRVKVGPLDIRILPKKPSRAGKPPSARKRKRLAKAQARQTEKWEKKWAKIQARQAKKQAKRARKPEQKINVSLVKSLIPIGLQFLGGLRRKLYLPELTVYLCLGGADAAAQAESYGRAWAILGAATPVLENTFRIGRRDLQAVLDWSVTSAECFVRAEARIRVVGVVYLALRAGVQFLKAMAQNKKKAVQTT